LVGERFSEDLNKCNASGGTLVIKTQSTENVKEQWNCNHTSNHSFYFCHFHIGQRLSIFGLKEAKFSLMGKKACRKHKAHKYVSTESLKRFKIV